MSKKICLDLDGVITDIGQQLKEYMVATDVDVDPYNVGEVLLTPYSAEYMDYAFQDPLFWRNMKPVDISWHCINDWFSNSYDIIFVTARRSDASINEIANWLDGWEVLYNDFIICDMLEKYLILQEINPLLFIDDNPHEISSVVKNTNVPAYALRTWYNQHLINDDIDFVDSLLEIKIG